MREQTNAILLCVFGAVFVLVNKPFGEACRRWQMMFSGRDYGLLSFRVPVVLIGSRMLLLGVSLFF